MSGLLKFLSKPPVEVYPLLAPLVGALILAGFMGYKHLLTNPDVIVQKSTSYDYADPDKAYHKTLRTIYGDKNIIVSKNKEHHMYD
eukprot:TRINITY_DN296_c0_g1_i1.p1 TRINITY_DN296_c0_g1~~TRINITY_DN296_c0_g1_i1.p1  ORF type:complete len:86 (+),score=12.03 TRINITY_DN296_c0_g1_i1:52-309(+)